jgi:hypothetical protein
VGKWALHLQRWRHHGRWHSLPPSLMKKKDAQGACLPQWASLCCVCCVSSLGRFCLLVAIARYSACCIIYIVRYINAFWPPGILTCFYNHAYRPRLETLFCFHAAKRFTCNFELKT